MEEGLNGLSFTKECATDKRQEFQPPPFFFILSLSLCHTFFFQVKKKNEKRNFDITVFSLPFSLHHWCNFIASHGGYVYRNLKKEKKISSQQALILNRLGNIVKI